MSEATTVGFKNNNIVVWLGLNLVTAYLTLSDAACSILSQMQWQFLLLLLVPLSCSFLRQDSNLMGITSQRSLMSPLILVVLLAMLFVVKDQEKIGAPKGTAYICLCCSCYRLGLNTIECILIICQLVLSMSSHSSYMHMKTFSYLFVTYIDSCITKRRVYYLLATIIFLLLIRYSILSLTISTS